MKLLIGLPAAALIGFLGHTPATAKDSETAASPAPDLVGTWTGSAKRLRGDGGAEGPIEIRVTEQDGPLFRAEKSWKLNAGGTPGSVGGKLVSEAVEPLIGVVDFDGRTLYLAEQGDVGTYTAHLTDPDTLQIVYVESGDAATIYRFVVKRAK
jgi:hypothetical protein